MAYVIGIDTGGTYTDAVLLDSSKKAPNSILRKAKEFTTHEKLEVGIRNSIVNLELTNSEKEVIDKVVLSTTLATNATVERKIHKVGLILLGGRPRGTLATEYVREVRGQVNIKGRVLFDIDKEEVKNAVEKLIPNVESIAVSGVASVRNPFLEQKVRTVINSMCDKPVVCGHELANDLGFLERTNTAIINAGLLPIINGFVKAIREVLTEQCIKAPVFVVKGDGAITKIDVIQNTPVDTVLSGPAASIIGAINLTKFDDAVVADMGGTTTDTGMVRNKRVELSLDGARVGEWKIRIKSAKLYTFGLGGDSGIKIRNGVIEIGPGRVLPACRGGDDTVTPTDILHYTDEFVAWNKEKAVEAIVKQAEKVGINPDEYVCKVKDAIAKKIADNLSNYKTTKLPIIAIGAPAESWYRIAKEKYGFKLVVPKHYEVANAVGAATAGIYIETDAVVRPGEVGCGFLVHAKNERYAFTDKEEAINKAIEETRKYAIKMIREQNLELADLNYSCISMYLNGDNVVHNELFVQINGKVEYRTDEFLGKYLETRVKVMASGKIFA